MNRSVAEQERDIRDILRQAKHSPDQHGTLRQETFKRLIQLAHSQHVSLKILAAGNMRFFLSDFPDLEEAAIDAIYDLCEDSSSRVRIEGYRAITQVSRVQSKWIKRNVDVLVQLLQSEEADEVVVVKQALVEHLDMDSKITIGVLCDQIIPRDDPLDEEEISIRERLRSLVLAFMAGEAKQAICERHSIPGGSGESVLYEGLFTAIPHLGMDDLQLVIKSFICALPAFRSKQPGERGSELLQLLLSRKVSPALRADLQSGSKALAPTTKSLLDICEHITCILFAAPAVDLLQFYCTSLIGKITLQKFETAEQQWIICHLARVLGVAENQETSQLSLLRRMIVDASPYLLEVLNKSTLPEPELQAMYGVFLRACSERTRESWTVPPHLLKILQEFRARPEIAQNQEYEKIIRSFTPPSQVSTPATSALQTNSATPISQSSVPPVLPPRAPALRATGSLPSTPKPTHNLAIFATQDKMKRDIKSDISARPAKRTKVEEVSSTPKAPSLLSRLGTSISRQSSRSDLSSQTQTPSPAPEETPSCQPSQELSIKGAAAKQAQQNGGSSSRLTSSSLLERLQDSYPRDSSVRQPDVGRRRRNV